MNEEMENTLTDMRGWLDENRDRYYEANSHLQNQEFVRKAFKTIQHWLDDVFQYSPLKHTSDVAVFILGQLQSNAGEFFEDINFIFQYEEEESRWRQAAEELQRQAEEQSQPHDQHSGDL